MPARELSPRWCFGLVWSLAVVVGLCSGCVTTEKSVASGDKPPALGVPCQIVATWQTDVAYAPDPTHGGAMNPGLAGRLYLFGKVIDFPMAAEGSLIVEMVDESKDKPEAVEQWRIDPGTMQRLLRQDMIGWGYTLFLPSGRYKPEMTKVRMRTCFTPVKGSPLFSESVVTLAAGNGMIREGTPLTVVKPPMPPTPGK
jgi:hypothetical protein